MSFPEGDERMVMFLHRIWVVYSVRDHYENSYKNQKHEAGAWAKYYVIELESLFSSHTLLLLK